MSGIYRATHPDSASLVEVSADSIETAREIAAAQFADELDVSVDDAIDTVDVELAGW